MEWTHSVVFAMPLNWSPSPAGIFNSIKANTSEGSKVQRRQSLKYSGPCAGDRTSSAVSCVCAAVSKKFKNINGNYHKIETATEVGTPTNHPTSHPARTFGFPTHIHIYSGQPCWAAVSWLRSSSWRLLLRRNLAGRSFD